MDARLEALIGAWRDRIGDDALERSLRAHLDELGQAGLAPEEALLVAARRTGTLEAALAVLDQGIHAGHGQRTEDTPLDPADDTAHDPADDAGHGRTVDAVTDRGGDGLHDQPRSFEPAQVAGLWAMLGLGPDAAGRDARREFVVMGALACAAAVAIKAPEVAGVEFENDGDFYLRNLSLLVLPFLAGYFAWKRRLAPPMLTVVAAAFALPAVLVNVYPFGDGRDPADTEVLVALHLPIAMWLVVGMAHAGGDWRSEAKRMDFVRFTGEWVIYYGLIALGGGVLAASTGGIFSAIGIDAGEFIGLWLVPCGAAGAVVVAGWLAESRQGVLERIAPVLTRLFTPLFAAMLASFLLAMALTRRGIDVGRGVLIFFDVLLALVLALVIYSVAARDPNAPRGLFDLLQLLLVTAALLVDLLVLGAIVGRLSDFGATPNRIAALGENLVLLANLAWTAWLYLGFWRGRRTFAALARWQTAYAPVYAVWLAAVVVVFPPVFGFA